MRVQNCGMASQWNHESHELHIRKPDFVSFVVSNRGSPPMTALFTTCSPAVRLRVLPPRSGGAQRILPIAAGSRSTERTPCTICITCIQTIRHNHNCSNVLTSNLSVQKNSLHMHKPPHRRQNSFSHPSRKTCSRDLPRPAFLPHPGTAHLMISATPTVNRSPMMNASNDRPLRELSQ